MNRVAHYRKWCVITDDGVVGADTIARATTQELLTDLGTHENVFLFGRKREAAAVLRALRARCEDKNAGRLGHVFVVGRVVDYKEKVRVCPRCRRDTKAPLFDGCTNPKCPQSHAP